MLAALVPYAPVALMGVSLGASIAASYAVHRPERLCGVVLIAPASTVLSYSIGFILRFAFLSLPIRARAGARSAGRGC